MREGEVRKIEAVVQPEVAGQIKIENRLNGERIAYAELMRRNQRGQKELVVNKFQVEPDYENLGYGKMLMDTIKDILKKEQRVGMLSVHASNRNAQGFYESQGWEFADDDEDMMPNRGQSANELQRWMMYEVPEEEQG